jgi:hypothetical protein
LENAIFGIFAANRIFIAKISAIDAIWEKEKSKWKENNRKREALPGPPQRLRGKWTAKGDEGDRRGKGPGGAREKGLFGRLF